MMTTVNCIANEVSKIDHPIIHNLINTGYPDGKTPQSIFCNGCGEELFEGDRYYPVLDLCEFCIDTYKKIIGKEELNESN